MTPTPFHFLEMFFFADIGRIDTHFFISKYRVGILRCSLSGRLEDMDRKQWDFAHLFIFH